MEEENPIWKLIERIENAFSKDDLKSAPREVLEQVIADTYDGLCAIADSQVDPWERDDVALAEIRNRILSVRS
jgi:hypothetical protein